MFLLKSVEVCRATHVVKAVSYKAPSSSTGASELEALEQFSEVVPDTLL